MEIQQMKTSACDFVFYVLPHKKIEKRKELWYGKILQ